MSKSKKTNDKVIAEFRRDMVCKDWVLVSSARSKRPIFGDIKKGMAGKQAQSIKSCPFEDPQKSGNGEAIFWLPRPSNGKKVDSEKFENWFTQVIQNKYPVVSKDSPSRCVKVGPHKKCDSFGFHEVVITRDHSRPLQKMTVPEIVQVLRTFQERYKVLERDERIEYILIYHNHGFLAGASIAHPHSQIVALPIFPPDISRSINGGLLFFEKDKKCVHCAMLEFERRDKSRIIYENEHFVVFAPYASKVSYEVRIFPKKHSSDFEETPNIQLPLLAEALKNALARLARVLGEFDYNFFIHTSSARVDNVPYYHWHIEILPRTYKWAGLELGSGVEVISTPPEQAAEELRNAKIGKV